MREFALCILPSSWCDAGVRNIGFVTQVCHRFMTKMPSRLLRQWDLNHWCSTELFSGWSFFDEKMHGKSLMFLWIPFRLNIKNSLNFNDFFLPAVYQNATWVNIYAKITSILVYCRKRKSHHLVKHMCANKTSILVYCRKRKNHNLVKHMCAKKNQFWYTAGR